MALFFAPDIEQTHKLPDEEAQHCLRVLRLKNGDPLQLTDGKGHFYQAEVAGCDGKSCSVSIIETTVPPPLWQGHIHIAVAPTKNSDRMEWLVEKMTEIGFDELSFLDCRFSERKVLKLERLQKIAVSAMKQSLKATLPQLNEMCPFNSFIGSSFVGQKFIAHCYEGEKPLLVDALQTGIPATILIGPEGDFSEEEVKAALSKGFVPISLGRSRLRTETAALAACHTYFIKNQS